MQLSGTAPHFLSRCACPRTWLPIVATGAAVGLLASNFVKRRNRSDVPYRSPLLTTLSSLSEDAIKALPYPPDAYPGARDVRTPFGSIRVYEWGPTDGKKVLLVHGISTPCISMIRVAHRLVERGCRVMVYDLFGRGYSGAPDPKTHRHDASLYITQILYVLASSSIPWTGGRSAGRFTIVGYSFGGGVSASFSSYFPDLVSNLVLIGPGGIMRNHHISWTSHILYNNGGLIPEALVRCAVRRRLETPPETPTAKPTKEPSDSGEDAIGTAEIATGPEAVQNKRIIGVETVSGGEHLVPSRPSINAAEATNWQIEHNEGFIPVFISAIQNGPITDEHDVWRKTRHAFEADAEDDRRVLLVLGRHDSIIKPEEQGPDALEIFGEDLLQIEVLDAGHELPMKKGEEIADLIVGLPNMRDA